MGVKTSPALSGRARLLSACHRASASPDATAARRARVQKRSGQRQPSNSPADLPRDTRHLCLRPPPACRLCAAYVPARRPADSRQAAGQPRGRQGRARTRVAPAPVPHAQLVVGYRVAPHVGAARHAVLLPLHQYQVLAQHLRGGASAAGGRRRVPGRPSIAEGRRRFTLPPSLPAAPLCTSLTRAGRGPGARGRGSPGRRTWAAMLRQKWSMPGTARVQCMKSRDMRYSRRVRPVPQEMRERGTVFSHSQETHVYQRCRRMCECANACSCAGAPTRAAGRCAAGGAAAAGLPRRAAPSLLGRHTWSWWRWFLQEAARAPRSIFPGEVRPMVDSTMQGGPNCMSMG